MGRKPELSFEKVYRMIGRHPSHPLVKEIVDQYHPYNIYENKTTGFATLAVETSNYTPEELIAMLLQHAKDMTNSFGGHNVKDCVITVPSYFTQFERDALYTAAQIADLKVLSLIEENTAAALHFSMDNVFEHPTNILYYNMGAGSAQVTIVSYSSLQTKEGGKNKTVGQLEVIGKAWDASLGGFNFDVILADLLAVRFNEAWHKKQSGKGKDLRNYNRPMTRLRIEATKVKEVLSANSEYPVRAEQLHADVDLVTKVTRADFEAACDELFKRITLPIEKALAMANLSISDIAQVELLGGGVRIPKVKRLLDEYFQHDGKKIVVGQHLNGDEAMALGAAFRAANLSTAFRVRKVGMTDISSFGVSVKLESQNASSEEWSKHTSLYPAKSSIPSKAKTVAFHYDQDIICKIQYDNSSDLPEGVSNIFGIYNISGVAAFAREHAALSKGAPKIHLSFSLDNSGMVSLLKAEATVEHSEDEPEVTDTVQPVLNVTDPTVNSTGTEQNSTVSKEGTKKKSNVIRRQLNLIALGDKVSPPKWTASQIQDAKLRLESLQQADKLRKAKEAALNELEAYIYKVKNRIVDEEDSLRSVSTEKQRQDVIDLASEIEEWLYDDGRNEIVETYKKRQKELETMAQAIFHRLNEVGARTAAIEKAKQSLESIKSTIETWAEKLPHITTEEKDRVLNMVKKVDDWIEEKADLQEKQSPYETAVFESTEVLLQLKSVRAAYDKLSKKPKPAPPVTEKVTKCIILFNKF